EVRRERVLERERAAGLQPDLAPRLVLRDGAAQLPREARERALVERHGDERAPEPDLERVEVEPPVDVEPEAGGAPALEVEDVPARAAGGAVPAGLAGLLDLQFGRDVLDRQRLAAAPVVVGHGEVADLDEAELE